MIKVSANGDVMIESSTSSLDEGAMCHVGKDGFVYHTLNTHTVKLDRNLNLVQSFTSPGGIQAASMDTDYDGHIYVTGPSNDGTTNYRLAKFTNEGTFIWGIDNTHELWEQLAVPSRIKYSDGRIYVSAMGWENDSKTNIRNILVFNAGDGTRLDDIGPFNAIPYDVDVAPLDHTVVAKYGEPWALGHVKYHEVVEKPWFKHLDRFRELENEPETPPSGMCVVWLDDDGDFKVKFDTGTVVVIASPT